MMCQLAVASNGSSFERVSDYGIGRAVANSETVKHRRDSAGPPEANYWKYGVPGRKWRQGKEKSEEEPMIPKLLSMRIDPRNRSTEGKTCPVSTRTEPPSVAV
jgi:hypothetical protein